MKINTEARDDHQIKVVAEFEANSLDNYKKQAARKIAGKAKIPGFRPGKAPYDVVSRLYGEPAIEEEAIELMVEDVYPKILDEAKINPAAPGTLEDISKEDPLKFTFIVPLEPTVDLGKYREIRKEYSPEPIKKTEVDVFIQRLQRTYATAEPVDRPAAKDDLVYIKINADIQDPAEGEKAELLKDSPLQLVIGENDPDENGFPYTGFGDALIGLSANETKKIEYTYPKDSKYEKLQGKKVIFNVTLESVKHLALPELNDEFAKMFGEYENYAQLKDAVKAQIEERHNAEYDQDYFEGLLQDVTSQATIKYPPQVLEHEMEHVVEDITRDLSQQHMELDVYLKTIKKEKDAWMEEEIKPTAKKRLEQSLVLDELSRAEKIQIGKEDLQTEITNMLNQISNTTDPKKLEKQLKSERVSNALTMQAANRVLNRNVFNRLKDIATGKAEETEKIASAEDAKPAKAKSPAKKAAKSETAEKPAEAEKAPAKAKKSKKTSEPVE